MKPSCKSLGAAIALALFAICSGLFGQAQTSPSPRSPTWPARPGPRHNIWMAAADLARKAPAENEAAAAAEAASPEQPDSTSGDSHFCPKIIKFDPPGAVWTTANGINQAGVIVGYYIGSDGTIHGFLRELGGSFTVLDAPGHGNGTGFGTIAWSINAAGEITGTLRDQQGVIRSWVRRNGEFTTFDAPHAGTGPFQGTNAQNINPEGEVAGEYIDSANVYHAFVRSCDGMITEFDAPRAGTHSSAESPYPGTFVTGVDGLNREGDAAGYSTDDANVSYGFVRERNGDIIEIEIADAGSAATEGTFLNGINDKRQTAGTYVDSANVSHGFIRDRDGSIEYFSLPEAGDAPGQGTYPSSINGRGDITGVYSDSNNLYHGFLRFRDGRVEKFDVPGATGTFPETNNASDAITGFYLDAKNVGHGFVALLEGGYR